uniref:Uncharacterized protein n=1 Tax=Anopheles atroparvus TaxID=41427 RepID=A0A182J5H3_ANOAO
MKKGAQEGSHLDEAQLSTRPVKDNAHQSIEFFATGRVLFPQHHHGRQQFVVALAFQLLLPARSPRDPDLVQVVPRSTGSVHGRVENDLAQIAVGTGPKAHKLTGRPESMVIYLELVDLLCCGGDRRTGRVHLPAALFNASEQLAGASRKRSLISTAKQSITSREYPCGSSCEAEASGLTTPFSGLPPSKLGTSCSSTLVERITRSPSATESIHGRYFETLTNPAKLLVSQRKGCPALASSRRPVKDTIPNAVQLPLTVATNAPPLSPLQTLSTWPNNSGSLPRHPKKPTTGIALARSVLASSSSSVSPQPATIPLPGACVPALGRQIGWTNSPNSTTVRSVRRATSCRGDPIPVADDPLHPVLLGVTRQGEQIVQSRSNRQLAGCQLETAGVRHTMGSRQQGPVTHDETPANVGGRGLGTLQPVEGRMPRKLTRPAGLTANDGAGERDRSVAAVGRCRGEGDAVFGEEGQVKRGTAADQAVEGRTNSYMGVPRVPRPVIRRTAPAGGSCGVLSSLAAVVANRTSRSGPPNATEVTWATGSGISWTT